MSMSLHCFYCEFYFAYQTPDVTKIIDGLKAILRLIFGEQVPTWILPLAGYVLLTAVILAAILGLLTALVKIKDLFTNNIWPIFYKKEKVRRSNRRRKFADHIESELRRLNNLEAWSDYRFTELEAEVDAEGRRRILGILRLPYRGGSSLRRERSLSKALKLSGERLVIVEGEPGSGKSIALRHVASMLAARAMRSRSTKSLIPIYVNLKEIERKREEAVDRNLIASFVLKVLNRVNDRDIEEFLEEEFNEGLQSGTWFFLFDSFDEIPEVLSSTEADKSIREYATAISDFLHGLNECRGVIASRFFHGPKQFGWPRFRILPLTAARRLELVRKADLKPEAEGELIGQLNTASEEIRSMANNPMFLGLLCEHMRSGYPFPDNSHTVLATYIESRLSRDKDRLFKRYRLDPPELQTVAETAAFCMAADPGLGLSPKRQDIKIAAQRLELKLGKNFDKALDAITYLKLARVDTSTTTAKSEQFTFAHRRFQEYFATAVVLREPHRVTPRQLLLDARWRETAVVMCQTQAPETLSAFIKEAEVIVKDFVDAVKTSTKQHSTARRSRRTEGDRESSGPKRFSWPTQALHIMGLLQDGFSRRLDVLPESMRTNIGEMLTIASKKGISADAKWALDVSGSAPPKILANLLRRAFNNPSQVLRDSAYRQVARLTDIPPDLAYGIRATLCWMTLTGRLRKERTATRAHLSKLSNSSDFLAALRLLLWFPSIDLFLHGVVLGMVLISSVLGLWFGPHADKQFKTILICWSVFAVPFAYFGLYWKVGFVGRSSKLRFRYAGNKKIPAGGISHRVPLLINSNRVWIIICWFYLPIVLSFALAGVESVLLFTKQLRSGTHFSIIVIWACASLWAPVALSFAVRGVFLNPLFWPIFQILAIGKLISSLVLRIMQLTRDWRSLAAQFAYLWKVLRDWKMFLFDFVRFFGIALLFGLAVGIVGLIGYAIYLIPYSKVIISIALGILIVAATGIWLYLLVHDLIEWHRWRSSQLHSVSADELIQRVHSFYLQRYRVQFINAVRTKGLMLISSDTEERIYNFAGELESPPEFAIDRVSVLYRINRIIPAGLRPFMKGTILDQKNEKFTRDNDELDPAVLDEVLRLLEQIRAAE